MMGYFKNTQQKKSWELLPKIKRYGTGLTQRVSMEDGTSGNELLTEINISINSLSRLMISCKPFRFKVNAVSVVIIYMKKLLDSDWLRAVQFKCNTSAKSITPVQKV